MRRLLPGLFLIAAAALQAQTQTAVDRHWRAFWIDVPDTKGQDYGVYHFRRSFELPNKPAAPFLVHVSGDNRYQLLVNGKRVAVGPSRGDLTHWRYETVDLAPHLHDGKNVLAAIVWNDGPKRAVAQISNQTGFLLEAEDPANAVVDTGHTWRGLADVAYQPQVLPKEQATGYYALGPTEHMNASFYPWGWEQPNFDDSSWKIAHEVSRAASRFQRDAPNRWMLIPSEIPLEEQTAESALKLRKLTGVPSGSSSFPASPLDVSSHSVTTVLLDQEHLTTAYPELLVSGGRDATVDLRYAETLYVVKAKDKGNRNDVEGKTLVGPSDTYLLDGGVGRTLRPLFWRTYRYLQVTVRTEAEPLKLESFQSTFSAYPFKRKASILLADGKKDAELQRILDTGWRTARLCAHETYMDCPAYEQLQYGGDARIQMLVSLYMTGDARLIKKGISLLDSSRTAEGATYSRAPSNLQQYIPPFSLWWIGMVHDYWMYVDDPDFVRSMLRGVRAVIGFYAGYQKENGSLLRMPWWNFVDWVKEWPAGEPPADQDGSSAAALDLQLLMAYGWAADLEKAFGSAALAAEYQNQAEKLRVTILRSDWDPQRGLFADQPSHRTYSQHVNTLAVLAHVVTGTQARGVVEKMFADRSLAQASIYFRAYTNATLREVGLGGEYDDQLAPWRHMLSQGLSTWAEWDGPDVRSDCHAWGASPNFEYLRTVAGVEPNAPGYRSVMIAPHPGTLQSIDASIPHPKGTISVKLKHTGEHGTADISLPADTVGVFVWGSTQQAMKSGPNRIHF